MVSSLIDKLQAAFPINRVVALLTPAFVAASGWVAQWTAKHVAFLSLDQAELTAVFIAGATAGLAAAYKWLDGWQKHERDLNGANPKRLL